MSILFFSIIVFVLSGFLITTIGSASRQGSIEREIKLFLKSYKNTSLISLEETENAGDTIITVMVHSPSEFTQRAINLLDSQIESRINEDIDLQFQVIPVKTFEDE